MDRRHQPDARPRARDRRGRRLAGGRPALSVAELRSAAPVEEPVLFRYGRPLSGVVTLPAERRPELPAVLLMNAGKLSRVGPNRLNVRLARRLAALGFVVLRLDFSGVGESPARTDRLPQHEAAVEELREAMDHLRERHGAERFLAVGFCSGAAFSLLAALAEERVAGAVLVNVPLGMPARGLALRAFARRKLRVGWRNVLSNPRLALRRGSAAVTAGVPAELRGRAPLSRDEALAHLRGLRARGVALLFVYSESDLALDLLRAVLGRELDRLRADGTLELEVIRGADHSFTPLDSQERLLDTLAAWAARRFAAPEA